MGRMCGNKSQLSEKAAWAAAHRFRTKGDSCHAYHCKRCGSWHIGSDRKLTSEYAHGMEET